jgi:hypothetical protein
MMLSWRAAVLCGVCVRSVAATPRAGHSSGGVQQRVSSPFAAGLSC